MEIPDSTRQLDLNGSHVGPANLAGIATQLELYGSIYVTGACTDAFPGMGALLMGTALEATRHIRTRVELWMGREWMGPRQHLELGDLFDEFLHELQTQLTKAARG
jgi:hypothetical protein